MLADPSDCSFLLMTTSPVTGPPAVVATQESVTPLTAKVPHCAAMQVFKKLTQFLYIYCIDKHDEQGLPACAHTPLTFSVAPITGTTQQHHQPHGPRRQAKQIIYYYYYYYY